MTEPGYIEHSTEYMLNVLLLAEGVQNKRLLHQLFPRLQPRSEILRLNLSHRVCMF